MRVYGCGEWSGERERDRGPKYPLTIVLQDFIGVLWMGVLRVVGIRDYSRGDVLA